MWISELLTADINLDWLHRRLPVIPACLEEMMDIAHFTCLINGAVLLVACFVVPWRSTSSTRSTAQTSRPSPFTLSRSVSRLVCDLRRLALEYHSR